MEKEGLGGLFNSRDGKVNIFLLFSVVLVFVLSALLVNAAITVNQQGPVTYSINNSRSINFTFNVVWGGDESTVGGIGNCSIITNITGAFAVAVNTSNQSANGTSYAIFNSSTALSWINFTFDRDGNFSWHVECLNQSSTGGRNQSVNRTLAVDSVAPAILLDRPFPTDLGGLLNITSNATNVFYVNISDNTTNAVWIVISSQATFGGFFGHYGTVADANGTNATMTLDQFLPAHTGRYNVSISHLLNFSSNFTSPGPHGLFFCANDTFGRKTCSEKVDFILKGMVSGDLESQFGSNGIQHAEGGFTFNGLDIRYGNGTDVASTDFLNPTNINLTFNINFTDSQGVFIVGGRINESALSSASRTNYSGEVTSQVRQDAGTGFRSNLTWVDIGNFIPKEVSYEFGIVQMRGTYGKVMFCNGTSTASPNCFAISQCNATIINIFNHTSVIPKNSACWLTSGFWGQTTDTPGTGLTSGFTYIFVDHFSGGLGANDFGQPNVTFNAPYVNLNNITLNRSTTLTSLFINFTVDDTDSTGLNLSANNSINLTVTLGGSVVAFFNYTNGSVSGTRLTCDSLDPNFPQNTTKIFCNVTLASVFLSNGTYTINVTGRDTGNNTNPMNVTTAFVYITVDQIPPLKNYFNLTNYSRLNNTGDPAAIELGTGSGNSRSQGELNDSTIYAIANWTDNLTQPAMALFQFYNVTGGTPTWTTLNTTNITPVAGSGPNTWGWSNFSFPIPKGHNEFEGKNVSFRIVANDTVNNTNTSNLVKNITVLINDTTQPTVIINGTIEVNGTNISNTRPLISWAVVTEPNQLTSINVSVDSTLSPTSGGVDGCGKSAFYSSSFVGTNNVEKHRNDSFQIESAGTDVSCPLANGTHFINITTVDAWGNRIITGHTFTIQADTTPVISFNEIYYGNAIVSEQFAVNQSNVTPFANLNFSAVSGGTGIMKTFSWTSSCNTSTTTLSSSSSDFTSVNLSSIGPFNYSSCYNTEANRTVSITVADSVGNSVTNLFQFAVDHLGPSIAVQSPADGARITGNVDVNVTAMDKMNRVASIRYFLDGGLTIFNHTINTTPITPEQGANSTIVNRTINFTPGTHTIIISVNDTLGNVKNSSPISFTVNGPIAPGKTVNSTNAYLSTINPGITVNTTMRLKDSNGAYFDVGTVDNISDNGGTYELNLVFNNSINATIEDFNGSSANWDKINFSVKINDTAFLASMQNNFSAKMFSFVVFNSSLDEFLPDADKYFGIILLPFNISSTGSLAQQVWFFPNESNLTRATDRINVSQCTAVFTAATKTPCWNYTSGNRTLLFVPHFSGGGIGNDSQAPTVNVTIPIGNQTISMFEANITVSADAVSCFSSVNGTESNNGARNISMGKSGNICIAQTERFKNLMANDGGYNFTFSVIDASGNVNSYMWKFNVSDTTAPDNGIVTSSGSTTGATITITGANESVNVSVYYNSQNASFSNKAAETDFNKTQIVTISGLSTVTTATTWFFNITVCDFNGNCKNNGTFEFTQTATAAAAAAAAAASSGGGGGGAAAPSAEAASTSKKWDSLDAGSSAVLTINNANIAVTGVVVDVKSAVTNAEVKVASLTSNPIATAAAAKVYQYLQITKSNIADTDASKITVSFKVPKSWLTTNSLAEGDVVLYRYSDSKWNGLPTTMSGSDANNILYSATTPGFSTFAVGSKEAAPVAAPAEAGIPTAEAPAPTAEAGAAPAAPAEPAMAKKGLSTTAIAWIVVAVIVVIAGLGYFMMQKKKAE